LRAHQAIKNFRKRYADLAPEAALEAHVALRAAEEIGHQGAERGAVADELDHARGDFAAEEAAAVEAAGDARGEFEFD
jgi:hypothetical protein